MCQILCVRFCRVLSPVLYVYFPVFFLGSMFPSLFIPCSDSLPQCELPILRTTRFGTAIAGLDPEGDLGREDRPNRTQSPDEAVLLSGQCD